MRTVALTGSQSVAFRFHDPSAEPSLADAVPGAPVRATNAIILGDTSAALLSPAPMIESAVQKPFIQQAPGALAPGSQEAAIRLASAGDMTLPAAAAAPAASVAAARRTATPQAALEAKIGTKVNAKSEVRTAAVAPRPGGKNGEGARPANRHVFVLNDAQIAAIKGRLHLSLDQEQMWPAVETALRTIAYSKSRDGRRKGGGATSAEVAALDPYGPEVQGLKSAAFPLIMSFSDEQRSEVRGVAHAMGLDQLASQL